MKHFNKSIFFLAATVLISTVGFSQSFSPQTEARLQSKLDSLQAAMGVQGISACVFYPNQGFWKGVSGFSHAAVPIVPEMRFGIASNSKLFTAVALLKAQELGLISLDDSLSKWLPPMPNIAPEISLRQLLNHTSGVFDITNIPGYADSILNDPNRIFQPEEVVGWVQAPLFPPGTGWSYSNTNYHLAGMVFEAAAGIPLEKFLRDNILLPNGLNATFFPIFDSISGTVARPWQNNLSIFNIPRTSLETAAWAAGAMYSTAEDMNRWYQQLLGGQILSASSRAEMLGFTGTANYGLGIQSIAIQGRMCYVHGGNIRGYRSFMLFDVETDAVISVLVNESPAPAPLLAEALLLCIVEEISSLSTTEKDALGATLKIFPNPTSGFVKIDAPDGFEIGEVRVLDAFGRLVLVSKNAEIDLADCPEGMYFLKISGKNGSVTGQTIQKWTN
jgi:D-alanyl-D-alanine carboxypeptidase